MPSEVNIYCDESCHLENDGIPIMVLGALSCPKDKIHSVSRSIRDIKSRHGLSTNIEVKWSKVSPAGVAFYHDLIRIFFETPYLEFRALVVEDKNNLDHNRFNQTHDDWYYKMYFDLLKVIIDPQQHTYNIYLDYKDTQGSVKVQRLHNYLANAHYDFSREIIKKIQLIRSDEGELLPLADLLIGAVAYANRELEGSEGKLSILRHIRQASGYSLTRTTLLRERKMNIFKWSAQRGLRNGI